MRILSIKQGKAGDQKKKRTEKDTESSLVTLVQNARLLPFHLLRKNLKGFNLHSPYLARPSRTAGRRGGLWAFFSILK